MDPAVVVLAVGACVAANCAVVGTFLVLRKMSMIGDAISHSVLPGIAIAFLITGTRATIPMIIGAGALGVLTVALVEIFTRSRRIQEDASIGVVFPALFALGVIIISRYAYQVDLDLDCVLYGEIAYTAWDILVVGGTSIGPKALWINGSILVLNVLFVTLLFKELKIATFDSGMAASLGLSPMLIHYTLMTVVSVTVVGAFESVGAILVVAMLIVPPATAYLLTDRLGRMLLLSVVAGILSSSVGYGVARLLDCSIAGAMATTAGVLFLLAFLFSPSHGMVARVLSRHRLGMRLDQQIVLVHVRDAPDATVRENIARRLGWPARRVERTLRTAIRDGRVAEDAGHLQITADGRRFLEAR